MIIGLIVRKVVWLATLPMWSSWTLCDFIHRSVHSLFTLALARSTAVWQRRRKPRLLRSSGDPFRSDNNLQHIGTGSTSLRFCIKLNTNYFNDPCCICWTWPQFLDHRITIGHLRHDHNMTWQQLQLQLTDNTCMWEIRFRWQCLTKCNKRWQNDGYLI